MDQFKVAFNNRVAIVIEPVLQVPDIGESYIDDFHREVFIEIDGYKHHIGRIPAESEERMMEYLLGALNGDPVPGKLVPYWDGA